MRRLRLTPSGETTLKAARVAWQRAQERFERALGTANAAGLRKMLAEVVEATR